MSKTFWSITSKLAIPVLALTWLFSISPSGILPLLAIFGVAGLIIVGFIFKLVALFIMAIIVIKLIGSFFNQEAL